MLQVIIVDDEARNRNTLEQLLKEYCPEVNVIAVAEDVLSGVKIIQKTQPDLVFLDIQMPNYSGFKLIEYFDEINFQIIFTTAHEHYAIDAFHANATGYLLKPIDIDELIHAVNKASKNVEKKTQQDDDNSTQSPVINPDEKIELPTKNGIIYLTINEIIYLKSEGRNTHIFLKNNQNVLTTINMKECEKRFFKTTLLRIHKSNMINLAYIKKYIKKLDAYVEMESGHRVDVGNSFKEQLNRGLSFFAK
ncbi:MAG: LytR/AlgR family response regulator transcription factor [Saprospiraceae bacterium]